MADQRQGGPVQDGRRAKGAALRRRILHATLAVIGTDGVAGVTQRAVAKVADTSPGSVFYHFASIDDLLVETLAEANAGYLVRVAALAELDDPLPALADLLVECSSSARPHAAAEMELYLQAARHPALRGEVARWWEALDDLLRPLVTDAVRRDAALLAIDGVFLRQLSAAVPLTRDQVLAILRSLAG